MLDTVVIEKEAVREFGGEKAIFLAVIKNHYFMSRDYDNMTSDGFFSIAQDVIAESIGISIERQDEIVDFFKSKGIMDRRDAKGSERTNVSYFKLNIAGE